MASAASFAFAGILPFPFRQPAQEFLQRLDFHGGGGVLSGVFLDDPAEVRLENAFAAQASVGERSSNFWINCS
jgi:hypothetical protein